MIQIKKELSSENAKLSNDYQLLFKDYKKVKHFFSPLLQGQKVFYVNDKRYDKFKGVFDCENDGIDFNY